MIKYHQGTTNLGKMFFRLVTSVGQRKNSESPWGIEPQTFGFALRCSTSTEFVLYPTLVTRRKNIFLNSSPSSKLTISTFLSTTNLPSGQGSSLFKLLLKKNPASQADEFWGFIQNGFPLLLCVGLEVIILGVGFAAVASHSFANGQQTSMYFVGQQDAGKSSKTSAHKD